MFNVVYFSIPLEISGHCDGRLGMSLLIDFPGAAMFKIM